MKTKTIILSVILIVMNHNIVMAQSPGSVGINTDMPLATLHVHGTIRVDSLKNSGSVPVVQVTADSAGNLFVTPYTPPVVDSGHSTAILPFGETISAGDLVSIGDGKSAYMSTYGYTAVTGSETSDNVRYVAQGFKTTAVAKSIRAVQITVPLTNGATHHFNFHVRANVNGIPGPVNLATNTQIFVGPATVTSASLFVFDPPLPVAPNTDYFLVFQLYVNTNTSRTIRTTTGGIGTGYLATSTNSGNTWTTHPTRDVEMIIHEIRTIPGMVYRAGSVWAIESLSPDQTTFLAGSGGTISRTWYDRCHGLIGVAKESGNFGDMKKVSLGPVLQVNQTLIPGKQYILSDTPGMVTTTIPSQFFTMPVGMAISTDKLLFDR